MLIGVRHELPHPLWAMCENNVGRQQTVVLRVSPEDRAHTAAERHKMALGVVVVPSLGLRDEILWRGPLNEPRLPLEARTTTAT
jgi:hypothetical protein